MKYGAETVQNFYTKKWLSDLYRILHDFPARRKVYSSEDGTSAVFDSSFIGHE